MWLFIARAITDCHCCLCYCCFENCCICFELNFNSNCSALLIWTELDWDCSIAILGEWVCVWCSVHSVYSECTDCLLHILLFFRLLFLFTFNSFALHSIVSYLRNAPTQLRHSHSHTLINKHDWAFCNPHL